jgi:hypothetical protein
MKIKIHEIHGILDSYTLKLLNDTGQPVRILLQNTSCTSANSDLNMYYKR